MALTIEYSTEYDPPAPVLTVAISLPVGAAAQRTEQISALCDSGADLTCLPAYLIEALGLLEVDEVQVEGYDGSTQIKPLYAARLSLPDSHSHLVRIVPTSSGEALLGRDVLNSLRLELNGPQRRLSLL